MVLPAELHFIRDGVSMDVNDGADFFRQVSRQHNTIMFFDRHEFSRG